MAFLEENARRPAIGVGVHDGLTARLAEMAGFDLVWVGSLEVSARFGFPDRNLITSPEMASVISEVRAATDLPIFVDADNGYGSDLTAMRAATLFEAAGAQTMVIEDNAFPKENSLVVGHRRLVDADDFVVRLGSVLAARKNLRIVARTEALVAGLGADEAVSRLRKYASAGIDGLFVQVNSSCRDLLFPVLKELRDVLPFVLAPTALPEVKAADYAEYGVSTVLFANIVVRRMVVTLSETLSELRQTECLSELAGPVAPVSEVFRILDRAVSRPADAGALP
jgi:2-methylisocitrate lyase-like PEP mutase family enzyme